MAAIHKLDDDEEVRKAVKAAQAVLANRKKGILATEEHIRYIYEYICSLAIPIFEAGDGMLFKCVGVFKVKKSMVDRNHERFGENLHFMKKKAVKEWANKTKQIDQRDADSVVSLAKMIGEETFQKPKKVFKIKRASANGKGY